MTKKKLVKHLASLNKKDIYIMDVGCARGRWGHNIKEIVEKNYKDSDIKFHIFSVTGGTECEERTWVSNNVTLHQLNLFKIENIDEELMKRNFDLNNKVDVIVSRWTLRHLVDPFGTVEKLYELLTPHGGKLLSNGFLFKFNTSNQVQSIPAGHKYIFPHSNATVLYRSWDSGRDTDQFILERNDTRPLELPLHYSGFVAQISGNYQCASQRATVVELTNKTIANNAIEILEPQENHSIACGDYYCLKNDESCKDLHARLKKYELLKP